MSSYPRRTRGWWNLPNTAVGILALVVIWLVAVKQSPSPEILHAEIREMNTFANTLTLIAGDFELAAERVNNTVVPELSAPDQQKLAETKKAFDLESRTGRDYDSRFTAFGKFLNEVGILATNTETRLKLLAIQGHLDEFKKHLQDLDGSSLPGSNRRENVVYDHIQLCDMVRELAGIPPAELD